MALGLRFSPHPRAALLATVCVMGAVGAGEAARGADEAKPAAKQPPVSFAHEVRPILSENCFACHGFDAEKRKGNLRLDTRAGAFETLKSGETAIVPGDLDESALIFRIEIDDDDEMMMPPKASGKSLSPAEIDVLKRWVAEGAHWSDHWSFDPPAAAKPPEIPDSNRARNPIDNFILARLAAEALKPADRAEPVALLRRVYLDLIGLPPTPADVDAFEASVQSDGFDAAYEKTVDRLLASPRYGEHMARFWLDAARYGDTHGMHLDNFREMWPYRDWVVAAFNANKPFDQFIVEQLAGDLLPNPTPDQLIATGFNRCHVSTSEGGSIEEEVYVRNVVDQVDTNGTVFLGLTIACSRCHDHKFDPITQKEYYQLFAFFNNIDGPALDGNISKWAPVLQVPNDAQKAKLADLDKRLTDLRAKLDQQTDQLAASYDPKLDDDQSEEPARSDFVWIDDAFPQGAKVQGDGEFVAGPDHPVQSGGVSLRIEAVGLRQKVVEDPGAKLKVGSDDVLFARVYLDPSNPPRQIMLQWRVGGKWMRRAYWGENLIEWGKDGTTERLRIGDRPNLAEWVRLEVPAASVGLKPGTEIDGWAFTQFDGVAHWDAAGLVTQTPQPGQTFESLSAWARAKAADGGEGLADSVKQLLKKPKAERTAEDHRALLDAFLPVWSEGGAVVAPTHAEIAKTEAERKTLDEAIATTLIYRERAGDPKPAYVLNRGEYDQRRDEVGRALPAFLPPLPEGAPVDRLAFARWLVAPEQPLTARVTVNRFWQQVFGVGLVKTSEDFGAQGEPPSHPELLDWLAVQFREDGWDVKRFMKRVLMSSTYLQSSRIDPESLAKDPENRLLARGPRFRLDAETLRDQAFYVGGMLVEEIGGPSVKPPQPEGLWEAVAYVGSNTGKFAADKGVDKVHRRSLYTFWKRTSPPPQMTTLDAPSRESCLVRRERTNTPLQALLLLNEPQYIEASRDLAERTLREADAAPEDRLTWMFRLATSRGPGPVELKELSDALGDFKAHYAAQPEAARALINIGEVKPDPKLNPADLAAWTMVGNVILNLDEVLTKN